MRVVISAGELSGDEHGAPLIDALRRVDPTIELKGMGLRNLKHAGLDLVVDAERSGSVMGFTEVFGSIGRILKSFSEMKKLLKEWHPDLLIIINYSDFNLALAKHARRAGIPVLFYIPPQVWAWRSGRVKTMRKVVDAIAVIFPFERDFYKKHGFHNAIYVGHPLADSFPQRALSPKDRRTFLGELGFNPEKKTVVIFPGSRRKELEKHLDLMIEAFSLLKNRVPDIQGVVGLASPKYESRVNELLISSHSDLRAVYTDSLKLLQCADAGLIKSGTSNLQAAFAGVPFAMWYIASPFSAFLVKKLVSLTDYSIVNILKSGTVKELVQEEATPLNAATELEELLCDESRRIKLKGDFKIITDMLSTSERLDLFEGCSSTSERVAKLALSLIRKRKDIEKAPSTAKALSPDPALHEYKQSPH